MACCLPTCANVCAGFISSWFGVSWRWRFFLILLAALCIWRAPALLCVQGLGHTGVPPAGHALRADVFGSIILVTSGGTAGQLKKLPNICMRLFVVSLVESRICKP